VNEPTVSQRDAASTIFNLPDYRVIDAADLPDGGRRVTVASSDPPGCPGCGVIASKVHSRRLQRVRDIPVAGTVEVLWAKRRWFCSEPRCGRGTFAESTTQVPRFARSTQRLKDQVVAAVIVSGRAAAEVARPYTPRHNGKVERYQRLLAEECLYARPYTSEHDRARAISIWVNHYNYHRPHTACADQPPASRTPARVNNVMTNYT
jgi:hypothetical protein